MSASKRCMSKFFRLCISFALWPCFYIYIYILYMYITHRHTHTHKYTCIIYSNHLVWLIRVPRLDTGLCANQDVSRHMNDSGHLRSSFVRFTYNNKIITQTEHSNLYFSEISYSIVYSDRIIAALLLFSLVAWWMCALPTEMAIWLTIISKMSIIVAWMNH